MKKTELQDLTKQTAKAVEKKLADAQANLVELQMKLRKGELTNPREPKALRRSIAQLKTLLTQKQKEESK